MRQHLADMTTTKIANLMRQLKDINGLRVQNRHLHFKTNNALFL